MDRQYRVAVVVGSLRKGSFTRMLANAAREVAPPSLQLGIVEIRQLSLYDQDLEGDAAPEEWKAFRKEIRSHDAVLFVTPEYNRSIPGCLKNAIDVGSRPYGQAAWSGKPCAVVSISPGALGAFGANHHLRQCLVFLDMPVLQAPEAYVGGAANLFDASGKLTNDSTREFLTKFMAAFAAWVGKTAAKTA
jgi:chromate reductase